LLDINEIEALVVKIHNRVSYIPGIDQNFIRKCLQGIASRHDNEVDEKIRFLAKFI
jgi:hypothetical protein